ncbi:hypothetical protein [Nostoc sp.]|uniref:hypothetical protein n=1 Tax=Nostoc sp. TaxID=1180 RepID=UPI002FF5AEA7
MGFIYDALFVEDIDALKVLNNSSELKRVDGLFLGVKDSGEGFPGWYRYNASSTAAEDLPNIVASSDGVGDWFSFSSFASDGQPGQNAYTITTASFVQPAVGSNVTVAVANSSWLSTGQTIFISNAGTYAIASIPNPTSITITNLYSTNTAVSSTIASPQSVAASGVKGSKGDPGDKGDKGDIGDAGSVSSASSIILTYTTIPTTASNELGLYADNVTGFLKVRKQNNGTTDAIALLDSNTWKYNLFYG